MLIAYPPGPSDDPRVYLVLWEAVEDGIIEPTMQLRRGERVFKSLVYERPRDDEPSRYSSLRWRIGAGRIAAVPRAETAVLAAPTRSSAGQCVARTPRLARRGIRRAAVPPRTAAFSSGVSSAESAMCPRAPTARSRRRYG